MKELNEEIRTGSFRHVYLLYGEESYLKLHTRDALLAALLPEDNGMNLNSFDGDHMTEGAVIDQAETLPFLSERRVIRLDRTGLFKAPAELLPEYLQSIPDYLYLVFTEDEVDKRSRMFKAVSKAGRCVEFTTQSEAVLSSWVVKLLGREGLKIRRANLEFLLERAGTDMNRLLRETDKLIHYCAGKEEVTREDIGFVVSDLPEDRVFDMITALTQHRRKEALDLYADLLSLKEPPLKILHLIYLQYNRLLMVKELTAEGLGSSQIAQKAGMPPFAVRKAAGLIRSYTAGQLRDALRFIAEADEGIKTGRLTDRLAVELVLVSLSQV